MSLRVRFLPWLVPIMLALGLGGPAKAHLTPNSEVRLAFAEKHVTADIIVPKGEYAYATGNPVANDRRSRALARRYLAERIRVSGADGRAWRVAIGEPEFVQIAGPPDLHTVAILSPPAGGETSKFTIEWRVLVDTLPNHFALFVIQAPGSERQIAGAVRSGNERLEISATEGPFAVLTGAIALGAQHIATGYDHLLFLLALLLPAPLVASGGAWRERRAVRATFGQLARIVTAFTFGHSITLVGATLGGWRLPVAPVEIAIAVSVLVSALHAIRPIFPGREPLIAGAFGLVHGLAFATLVRDAGAGLASSAAGLFGFNLGIEIVQLGVVIVVVPPLVLMSRRAIYPAFRTIGGGACALAATIWIIARSIDAAPGLSPGATGTFAAALAGSMAALAVFRPRADGAGAATSNPPTDKRGHLSGRKVRALRTILGRTNNVESSTS